MTSVGSRLTAKPWLTAAAILAVLTLLALPPRPADADHLQKPDNVTATPQPDGLLISWDRVPHPGHGSDIWYYLRYRVKEPRGAWQGDNALYFRIKDGASGCADKCSFNLSNAFIRSLDSKRQGPYPRLVHGTAYDVQVSAAARTASYGQSHHEYAAPASAVFGAPVAPDPTLQSDPTGLTVTWTAPGDNGAEITGYSVRWKQSDAADWDPHDDTGLITTLNVTIYGLEIGAEHDVQVRAQNSRGWSNWSAVLSAEPGSPHPPSGLTLHPGPASLTVAWTAPDDNGAEITGYRVRWRKGGENGLGPGQESGVIKSLKTTIRGLEPDAQYFIQVRAQNSRGWGPWSSAYTGVPVNVGGM